MGSDEMNVILKHWKRLSFAELNKKREHDTITTITKRLADLLGIKAETIYVEWHGAASKNMIAVQ